jgi:hypothetical protein
MGIRALTLPQKALAKSVDLELFEIWSKVLRWAVLF